MSAIPKLAIRADQGLGVSPRLKKKSAPEMLPELMKGVEEEDVITPAKPEIVRGSSELLPPDVWEPPAQDPPTEDEEPITKEAPVKPDEDARGIIGLWFEGNVRARAYRKMGRA